MAMILIVINARETIAKRLVRGLTELEIRGRAETIQTSGLLRSARILSSVLETWGVLLLLKLQWKTTS